MNRNQKDRRDEARRVIRAGGRWIWKSGAAVICLAAAGSSGCITDIYKPLVEIEETGDRRQGITYYVGGAGPIGNVGSWDVPRGMEEGGYPGFVQVFTWQGLTHAGDQINLGRNREKGQELAGVIKRYRVNHPEQQINLIALSAGTGIATFALEYLPEGIDINHVVYLGCSLSSRYDLTRMLKRIRGKLYVIYSKEDRILKDVVRYTGTVDRSSAEEGVAGLDGFEAPSKGGADTQGQYSKVINVSYRTEFGDFGYTGGHMDATKKDFVREFLAPTVMGEDGRLVGVESPSHRPWLKDLPRSTTQPVKTAADGRDEYWDIP